MQSRIVVFGYSDVGYACLQFLLDHGENVLALFTHADDSGERQWFKSCATLAQTHGVPVYTEESADAIHEIVRSLAPDLIFSFYYRRMLPERILAEAKLGAYNIHGSLLPAYRGRAPLNWAIIHGEKETGVTLHVMVKQADAGDIIDRQSVSIGPEETAGMVAKRIPYAAVRMLSRQIEALKRGTAPREVQDEALATYFGKRTSEDGRIDWTLHAQRVFDFVRALTSPFPGAFTAIKGRKILIWSAAVVTGQGKPGEVLSVDPLVIAAGNGAIEAKRFGYEGERETEASPVVLLALKQGDILG